MGYQDAIEDLLNFLDKENLGLGDGEGWKVRQWATERSDGIGTFASDEEDRSDGDKRNRSASPMVSRKDQPNADSARQSPGRTSPQREEQNPVPPQQRQQEQRQQQQQSASTSAPANDAGSISRPAIFTFAAGPQFPESQEQDVEMQASDNRSSPREHSPVNISVLPSRNPRHAHRHNNNNHARSNQRAPSSRESSVGLGSKRKLNFPDFFDLSGLGNGRDMFGGGKRGRFI